MAMLDLPREILAAILRHLEPQSVIRFGQSCKAAHALVGANNQTLWKSAYLHVFDDPNDAWSMTPGDVATAGERQWNWHHELVRKFRALHAVRSGAGNVRDSAKDHIEGLLSILDTAKFKLNKNDLASGKIPQEDDRYTSLNLQILSNLIVSGQSLGVESLIYDGSGQRMTRSMTANELEKHRPEHAARLHVMYGTGGHDRLDLKIRGAYRRKVYNWSLTGPENDYAPLHESGGVDWPLLEAVVSVIGRNFTMCTRGHLSMPDGFCFSIPYRTLADPTVPNDWARVTGYWLGTYSFLDYADLFAFNNWEDQLGARPTLEDEPEDSGDLLQLTLQLDQSISSDPRFKSLLPVSTDLPVLYFSGFSRGYELHYQPLIRVRGCASLIPGAREVRWRFIINYGGRDQWQLEGVQPGGIRSGGVFGIWTQCDHEVNGPVGPFCYFPMELCKSTSMVRVS